MIGVKPHLGFVRQVIKTFGVVVTVTVLVPDTFESVKYISYLLSLIPTGVIANDYHATNNKHSNDCIEC